MISISFTTDYGLADGFVAACHGVILRAVPDARIIDVTHLVPPGDVRRAAAVLAQTVGSLPPGVHLAVVDPGVGTSRRAVALRTPAGRLVGPDNGLLLPAAERLGGVEAAVDLPVPAGVPATFHGRDVFAPAAAALAGGRRLEDLGVAIDPASLVRPPAALAALRADGTVRAEVVLVDVFGNVQLAASGDLLAAAGLRPPARAVLRRPEPGAHAASGGPAERHPHGVGRPDQADRTDRAVGAGPVVEMAVGVTFGSVEPGQPVLYVDAAGMAALAVRDGDAATALALAPGDIVDLHRRDARSH